MTASAGWCIATVKSQASFAPGVDKRFDPFGEVEVKVHNIALRSEYTRSDENALIGALGSRLAGTFVLADLGVGEVGLLARRAPGGGSELQHALLHHRRSIQHDRRARPRMAAQPGGELAMARSARIER